MDPDPDGKVVFWEYKIPSSGTRGFLICLPDSLRMVGCTGCTGVDEAIGTLYIESKELKGLGSAFLLTPFFNFPPDIKWVPKGVPTGCAT